MSCSVVQSETTFRGDNVRFAVLCLVVLGMHAWGITIPKGKCGIEIFPVATGIVEKSERNISVVAHPLDKRKGIALIPVDYYAVRGDQNLTWKALGKTWDVKVSVIDANYTTETLSVDPAKVTPPVEMMERIEAEKAEAEALYKTFTPIRYWDKPFILPMESTITSEYGAARTYNGTLKSYHGGTDFRARTPLAVAASNDGIVVMTKERYYAGNTIVIDHGEGVYSCYFHMSRFDVKVGDYVKRGDIIGLTGETGRITGPHLHFGMMVLNTQTDPLYFIAQINALFSEKPSYPADPQRIEQNSKQAQP